MERIPPEPIRCVCPAFADVLIGCQPPERLQAPDGGRLDRPVHPLDLAIRPGVVGLGQSVFDAVFTATQKQSRTDCVPQSSVNHVRHVPRRRAALRPGDGVQDPGAGGLQIATWVCAEFQLPLYKCRAIYTFL